MADYFGLNNVISFILLIIPITCWVLGIIARIMDRCFVAALLRFIFGGWLLWIADIISTIMNGCKVKIIRCINV